MIHVPLSGLNGGGAVSPPPPVDLASRCWAGMARTMAVVVRVGTIQAGRSFLLLVDADEC